MAARQSGFTLIEIALVLVIVGLLLGGMLRAQELVHGAKVKSLANDFRAIPTYIYAYHDRFRAFPGDDSRVALHLQGATAAGAGTRGNGRIDAAWNATAPDAESRLFWQHVRLANLAAGPVDPGDPLYTPRNAVGGIVGISGASAGQLQVAGMQGDYQVCSSAIPGRVAKQLDAALDDADTARGQVRAVADGSPLAATAVANAAIDDTAPYTVCMTF
jgi:prepilin-type N-terminal cleavage/methylation domain-containing protein